MTTMRIGIDVRKIADSGIGRHIENLIENLVRLNHQHEFVLFFSPGDIGIYKYNRDGVRKVVETSGKYSLKEHWSLPINARKCGVDLFHSPHYTLPRFYKGKSVVTIHDIIHLLEPSFGYWEKTYARWMIASAISRAGAVITVSRYTKEALIERFGAPERKIHVIHNGGGADFHRPEEASIIRELEADDIHGEYHLYVGSDRPHKNLKAVAALLEAMNANTRFLIVGRVAEEIQTDYKKRFGKRTIFRNNVAHNMMATYYAGARALLFPSYHEGFGLPPLEAMACKTPVIASNSSSIPEVVGDAALLVDPDDIVAMAAALEKTETDHDFRRRLIESGHKRAQLFSWEKMAKETLKVYEEVGL